jgi:hypothetical protein
MQCKLFKQGPFKLMFPGYILAMDHWHCEWIAKK